MTTETTTTRYTLDDHEANPEEGGEVDARRPDRRRAIADRLVATLAAGKHGVTGRTWVSRDGALVRVYLNLSGVRSDAYVELSTTDDGSVECSNTLGLDPSKFQGRALRIARRDLQIFNSATDVAWEAC